MVDFFKLFFTWWSGRTIGLKFAIWRRAKFVGEDEQGNKYYKAKSKIPASIAEHRWVVYNGYAEASAIPAGWHGWMHHKTDVAPSDEDYQAKDWQQAHQPNHTGSALAYRPPASILAAKTTTDSTAPEGEYEPWQPA